MSKCTTHILELAGLRVTLTVTEHGNFIRARMLLKGKIGDDFDQAFQTFMHPIVQRYNNDPRPMILAGAQGDIGPLLLTDSGELLIGQQQ